MQPRPAAVVILVLALAGAVTAAAATRTYVVDASASAVRVHVGKSGVFGFAGHTHEVAAERFEGRVEADPDDPARSSVELSFEAAGLKVSAEGEPEGDAPKVQDVMAGPKVLDTARFATIVFRSRQVSGRRTGEGVYELQVTGELSLHGVARPVILPVRVELSGDTLTASGKTTLAQRAFGIEPVSAGGGTVKVKNDLGIEFRVVARAK
jgi:polyisoprenoid-binding protein YceI